MVFLASPNSIPGLVLAEPQVGHGAGAFNWTVAEAACCEQGFWPDVISTDLHKMTNNGPAYDLPTVMTKFLHLGMSLFDVIKVQPNSNGPVQYSPVQSGTVRTHI